MKKILYISLAFLLFGSCTTDEFMDYSVVEFKPQLGLAGYISNDSIYLCLTQTKAASTINPYEPQVYIPTVTDTTAKVSIFENENYYISPGTGWSVYHKYIYSDPFEVVAETKLFYISHEKVTPGKTYTVKIEDDEFGTIEAVTEVPLLSKVTFNTASVFQKPTATFFQNTPGCINPSDSLWYKVYTITINDSPTEDNYYGLYIGSQFGWAYLKDSTCECYDFNFNDATIEFTSMSERGTPGRIKYFSDKLFNGQSYKMQFTVLKNGVDSASVDFYHLSKEYYQYMESVYQYRLTQYDPFRKPVTIYSNTTNQIGIWGGYYKETFKNY